MYKAISYTLIFLGIQLLASGLVTVALMAMGRNEWLTSPYTSVVTMILFSLTALIVFLRMHWAEASGSYLRSRPWGVVAWSVLASLGVVLPSVFVQELLPELPNIVEEQLGAVMSVPGGYFVVCLAAPVVEELVMRGAVLRSLLQWKPERRWAMIAVSALLFALMHLNPAQMPHAFVMGLLLGWMFERTGSIVPGVAFHWANNTVAFFLFRLYPDPNTHLIDILGTDRQVYMAVGFSLLILLPSLYQLFLRMQRV